LHRSDIDTGARLTDVIDTAAWLAGKLGKPTPALLGRAGPFP
jgi:hydroxymethylglutaryl-CoA lyase